MRWGRRLAVNVLRIALFGTLPANPAEAEHQLRAAGRGLGASSLIGLATFEAWGGTSLALVAALVPLTTALFYRIRPAAGIWLVLEMGGLGGLDDQEFRFLGQGFPRQLQSVQLVRFNDAGMAGQTVLALEARVQRLNPVLRKDRRPPLRLKAALVSDEYGRRLEPRLAAEQLLSSAPVFPVFGLEPDELRALGEAAKRFPLRLVPAGLER
ncbi:MAG: hypothetical protein KC910_05480 [Candidatus Eremiobacteraeota bacterium]|nr:hypothetical protein [Candidatus Eremiobacteraeota bacterium]